MVSYIERWPVCSVSFNLCILLSAAATAYIAANEVWNVNDEEDETPDIEVVVLEETHVVIERDLVAYSELMQVVNPVLHVHLTVPLLLENV